MTLDGVYVRLYANAEAAAKKTFPVGALFIAEVTEGLVDESQPIERESLTSVFQKDKVGKDSIVRAKLGSARRPSNDRDAICNSVGL